MAFKSRDFTIEKNGVVLAGLTSKDFNIGATPIEKTNDDDNGWRTNIDDAVGQQSIDISASGVLEDPLIRNIMLNPATSKTLSDITIRLANGSTIGGTFQFTNYAETGSAPDGRVEFSTSLELSGEPTFTNANP